MNTLRLLLPIYAFAILGFFADLSANTGGGYTPANGDVVEDAWADLFLVSVDSAGKYSLIPVAPTRSDPNVYEYASWRSREMQLGLTDLTGTSVERADKAEAQLSQSAIDGIVAVSTSGNTSGGSYTPANGDVVEDASADLFLVSVDSAGKYSLIPVAPTRSDPNVYEYASWRARELQTGLTDLTGTSVERADKAEAQLSQSAIDGIVAVSTSGNTSGGSYTPANGDVVEDASADLFLVSVDSAGKYSLIPVAPTRSDPNVYEYASWRSRELQLGLRDLTGTSVERSDKAEAQLSQSAIDGIVAVSTSGNTSGGSYTPANGDVVEDASADLFLVSVDSAGKYSLIPVAPTRSDPNVYEYASWRSRELQLGLRDLTGTSVERSDKAEAQLSQSAIDGIVAVSTSGNTSGGSYTPANGDVVEDASADLFLVSVDSAGKYSLIPVAPTRSDPNVYEYASWRSREMQLGLRDLTGTSVERSDKAEAQLSQTAIDGIVAVSTSGNTSGGSYTPKNGDVVADGRGDLFLLSMDRSSDTIALIPIAPTRSDPNVYEYASWRSRELQLGLRDLTGTSVERSDKAEAQLSQSAIDGIVAVSTSGNTSGGSYTPKNGDVVADGRGDLFLVSMDRSSDTIALIPIAPTRSDPNVYEYASWRSREMQLGLRDLTGTSVERSDKAEAQLSQSAIDGIVAVSTSGNTSGGSYTPKNGDVVADGRGDLFLVSMDRSSDTIALIPIAPTRSDPNVYEYASWRSREMQLGLRDLTGTSVERSDKAEAKLNQSAVDGIISASPIGGKLPVWFAEAKVADSAVSNWFTLPWFGSFHLTPTPWIYHTGLGWLHTASDGAGNIWLWREGQGWCWTGKDIYPWLYRHETAEWIYYLKTSSGKAYFFHQTSAR